MSTNTGGSDVTTAFPPDVERWRSTVAKYFPPELVNKALWTIQHESGGNPGAVGDKGAARGLFQIQDKRNFSNRPDAAYLDNPENNIKYAAQELGAASGNFGAWGEGTNYNGQPFGAFGNNAYPGGSQMSTPSAASTQTRQNLNKQRGDLSKVYDKLLAKVAAGDTNALSDLQDVSGAIADIDANLISLDDQDYTRGQDAFGNSISLGDYQQKQADSAYQRWANKRDAAASGAQHQIDQPAAENAMNASLAESFAAHPSDSPVPGIRTQYAANYDDAITKWNKKYNVGDEPSGNPADYGGPSLPTYGSGSSSSVTVPLPPSGIQQEQPKGFFDRPRTAAEDLLGGATPPPPSLQQDPAGGQTIGPYSGGAKKAKKWWQTMPGKGVLHFAGGTRSAPGGPAMVGEKGPETMIGPDGQPMQIGQGGPQVMDVPQGSQIFPADVPPDEAYAYSQITSAVNQGGGGPPDRATQMVEAAQRANDPELQQKVMESLRKAIDSQNATKPPNTPALRGNWTKYPDPWADWRGLTGQGPDGQPYQPQPQQGVM